jgi:hypothetical protein
MLAARQPTNNPTAKPIVLIVFLLQEMRGFHRAPVTLDM